MRLLNKLVVGASSVALAAALVAGVNAPAASAADTKVNLADKIDVYLNEQGLSINSGLKDKKISVSFPTVKNNKITGEKNVCTYDYGSEKDLYVDLSTLNVAKDNYIKVWGDVNKEPVYIKIPKNEGLGKSTVTYSDKDAILNVKTKAKADYTGTIQYAIGTGSWRSVTGAAVNVNDFTALGATLRVRTATGAAINEYGSYEEEYNPTLSELPFTVQEYTIKSNDKKVKVYELKDTFPSKEIKVKVAKKAAAPKVKVDYKKGTVTLPKNAQYRVNVFDNDGKVKGLGDWSAVSATAKTLEPGEELNIASGGAIDVRTKANNKPVSMYLAYTYKPEAPIEAAAQETVSASGATIKVTASESAITLAYTRTVTTGKRASTSGSITITPNADYAFEYYLAKGSATAPARDVKGTKAIKKGTKTVKVNIKNDSQYTIYVRRAAVTKGEVEWATEWVKALDLSNTDLSVTYPEITK